MKRCIERILLLVGDVYWQCSIGFVCGAWFILFVLLLFRFVIYPWLLPRG